jgi:hypothetical protein
VKISIRGLAAVVCAGAVVLSACSSNSKSATSSTTSDAATQGNQSPLPTSTGTQHALINDPAGKVLMTADIQGSLAIVQVRDQVLTGRVPDPGRRRYALNGTDIIEVRSASDGFKLKDPTSGATKWKVKIGTDKTEIRQGEDTELYTIRPRDASRIDVKKGEADAGRVERSGLTTTVKAADGSTVATVADGPFIGAYGVLQKNEIPETERGNIVAELIARNQQ